MDKYLLRQNGTQNESSIELDLDSDREGTSPPPKRVGNNRKKVSSVWNYFIKSKDKKLAKCNFCGNEYKTSGNTSNLADHIKRFHTSMIEMKKNEEKSSSSTTTASSSARSSVRSVSPFFKKSNLYENHSARKKELDRALTLFIGQDLQPFSVVNDKGFKNLIQKLDPRYVLPSKTTIRDTLMKQLFDYGKNELREVMNKAKYISITCDCWTSRNTESYLTVTSHFITTTSTFELRSAVLSTKPLLDSSNHSAQNIANSLNEVFSEWNIKEKVTCIVTDNASSMKKAAEILKLDHLGCYAHTLNLVVQDALKLKDVETVMAKCKQIVRYFKSSTIAMAMFKEEQCKKNEGEPYKLIQEVPTRWNSTYLMIERILQTHEIIGISLLKLRNSPAPFSAEEINILKEIERILRSFNDATQKMSAVRKITVSLIIPITFGIHSNLIGVQSELETEEAKNFCSNIINSVKSRLFSYEIMDVPRIASILDPRFKKESFKSSTNANHAVKLLEKEMKNFISDESQSNSDKSDDEYSLSARGVKQNQSLLSFLEERTQSKNASTAEDAILIKQYLARKNASEDSDPLLFWKVNQNELNPMVGCALKYLCIPASSVDSERVFSTTGQIISERRSRLKFNNVDMLTFLNKNVWLFEE